MGFFTNIIQDSRRAITTDVRVPEVSSAPILTPFADEGASEMTPSSDGSQTFQGSESRSQPAMPLETHSGLKTKRGQSLSTTNPKNPQTVQQEINPSPDVIQTSIVFPRSFGNPGLCGRHHLVQSGLGSEVVPTRPAPSHWTLWW